MCDGDTIFIDASTQTECMTEFLADKKDITVITNNMAIVMHLSEYGIKAICLGGKIIEVPYMLSGVETVENVMKHHANKMFFSTGYVSEDGRIGDSDGYFLLHTAMMNNAKEIYLLADHEKLGDSLLGDSPPKLYLCDFSKLTGVVSDYEFSEETQKKYFNTKFYKV